MLVRATHAVFGTCLVPDTLVALFPSQWTLVDDDDPDVPPDPYPGAVLDAQLDAQVAALVSAPASASAVQLRAALVARWQPNMAYAAGFPVLNPSGQIVTANSSFTSGSSYNASNWTVVSGGSGTSRTLPGYWVEAYSGIPTSSAAMDGTLTSPSTVIQGHVLAADCTELRVVLPFGWVSTATTGAADAVMANSTPTKVALQVGSTTYPVTFGGNRTPTCDVGGRLISDPIGGVWAKGTQVITRILNTNIAGTQYPVTKPPVGPGAVITGINRWSKNTDSVDSTAAGTSGTIDTAWGASLLGRPLSAAPFSLGAIGDSITDGTGDTGGTGYSWFTRATNATVPSFRFAKAGMYAQGVAAAAFYSLPMMAGCTHAVVMLGVNDLIGGRTSAQVIADLTLIYRALAGSGVKPIGATITPRTSSTDSWATTGGQTPNGTGFTGGANSERAKVNAWIRAGGGGLLKGYVDTADAAESARDSGLWKAGYTSEGLHPNATGHAAMAPALDVATVAAL